MRDGPRGVERRRLLVEGTLEELAAPQVDAEMEALEAIEKPNRLVERRLGPCEALDPVERKAGAVLERAERPEVDRHARVAGAAAGRADRSALRHVERDGARTLDVTAAPDAAAELRPQAERRERLELEERVRPPIRARRLERRERIDREPEEPLRVAPRGALRREAVEELEEEAAEREAPRVRAEADEGVQQARVLEPRERAAPRPLDLDAQVVEEVEDAREAPRAPARALRDRGEAPAAGKEQVDDEVGLAEVDGPEHQRFAREGGHR
jgi:hypothetical protein